MHVLLMYYTWYTCILLMYIPLYVDTCSVQGGTVVVCIDIVLCVLRCYHICLEYVFVVIANVNINLE